jgi:glycine hydroxymethyltransferase
MIMCSNEFAKAIDKAVFPGIQGGPLMHVIAAKAVSFKEIMSDEFKDYQAQIVKNAKVLANTMLEKGLNIVSGGTDNHLMLVDLRIKGVTGKEAQFMLDDVSITVNKNGIPFDTQSPFITSGVRIGTPAVTARGMKENDMVEIADLINLTITDFENSKEAIKARVKTLCDKYPLYK